MKKTLELLNKYDEKFPYNGNLSVKIFGDFSGEILQNDVDIQGFNNKENCIEELEYIIEHDINHKTHRQ